MKLRLRLALTVLCFSVPLVAGLAWVRADLRRQSVERGLREFALARMEAGDRERCEEDPSRYPIEARALLRMEFADPLTGRLDPEALPGRGPGVGERGRPPEAFRDRPGGPGARRLPGRGPFGGQGRPPAGEEPGLDRRPPPPEELQNGGPRRLPVELFAYDADFHSANPGVPDFPPSLRAKLANGAELASLEHAEDDHFVFELALRTEWSDGPCANLLVRRRNDTRVWQPENHIFGALLAALLVTVVVLVAAGPLVARVRKLTDQVRRSAAQHYALPIVDPSRDELGQLARAFDEVGQEVRARLVELQEREERLRRFVENTTHDVAIPLTVLQGHLSELSAAGASAQVEHLAGSIQEAHYIAAILSTLGVAARLEALERELERSPLDLSALVERVSLRHQMIAREGGVQVEHSVPEAAPIVAGDVTLMEQALGNVVHNAVRFNRAGGHVAVILSATSERFLLRVIDDGPGIAEGELEKIVERSYRGDEARTRQPSGRGLGLHIVKEVLQRHGFELELGASEYGGLEVRFSGPLQSE